ncbi:hypothetical protein EON81_00220 [bacterium]|nr:MAG: hypothetical protein EON81_00220 [bacterium]
MKHNPPVRRIAITSLVALALVANASPAAPRDGVGVDAAELKEPLPEATLTRLRCDNAQNPLGIDHARPRLSWIDSSSKVGQRQSAFQILVASSPALLAKGKGDLWDSGRVVSDESIGKVYGGKPLASRARCYWKVRTWDGKGKASSWSGDAFWTMGLLKPADWKAHWIGHDEDTTTTFRQAQWIWSAEGDSTSLGTRHFRRIFDLGPGQKVARAVLDLAVDNTYALSINGRKTGTGDNWMKPGRHQITPYLRPGKNTIEIEAANIGASPNPAGLIAHLRLEFDGGTPFDIVSDASWESSADGTAWTKGKALAPFGQGPWSVGAMQSGPLSARYLRRDFKVEKRVVRATAYACGLGFFDLSLNGKKVSDHVMDPVLSDYDKASYYVTFDVTKQLRAGENAVGVVLGNGRYYAPRPTATTSTQTFGYPKLLLQLEIEYADGTKESVVTDERWRLDRNGPILESNEYDGEAYDARLEKRGWDMPGFAGTSWEVPNRVGAPLGSLRAQTMEPMRVTQIVRPVSVRKSGPGRFLVDMGQNFYGTVRMKASGPRGTQVRMVSAYNVNPDGSLKTADNRTALSTDVYTFKGEGVEVWNPRFRGQGYRRVEVTGFPGTPTAAHFEGLVIHTDMPRVGDFQCSNEGINRLHSALRWGMRSFMRSAPLDPDRDERQPWTGDPAKDAESEAFNFDVSSFYTKWMDDIGASQRPDGTLPDVVTYWNSVIFNGRPGVEWPSVFTIIPDWFIDFYGDSQLGRSHYPAMRTWVRTMNGYTLPDGTLPATSFGDWCDASTMDGKTIDHGSTPRELISTAYQYNNCRIVARLAKLAGEKSDEADFSRWAEELKAAFNQKFFDPTRGSYLGETQCGYVLALKFGLVPDEYREKVIANLVDDIMVKHDGHLTVGLIGMQWLMQTLTEVGHPEVAWTLATQTTRPSWGYMLSKGATTIWERWDYDTRDPGMNSENLLIQAGNLDAWFYQTLAGIDYDPAKGGFKRFSIRPHVLGDLTWAKAHFDSPYGRIESAWKRDGKRFTLDVTVPANTTATVVVPGNGGKHEVGPGAHRFLADLP